MTDFDTSLLGTLTDISGARFIAQMVQGGDGFEPYRQMGVEKVTVGQIGTYVIAQGEQEQVLSLIHI